MLEVGPLKQSQRDLRRPLAQRKPSAAPNKEIKAVANPGFHPSLPPKPHQHHPGHDFAQKFHRCIPVTWGLGAARAHPTGLNKDRCWKNMVFIPLLPPKPHQHHPGHDFAQKFDGCIPVTWGLGATRAHPTGVNKDRYRQNNLLVVAALRGGRMPSFASLVANG